MNITILICLAAVATGCSGIEKNNSAGQSAKSAAARKSNSSGFSSSSSSNGVDCVSAKITDLLLSGGGGEVSSQACGGTTAGGNAAERQNAANIEVFYSSPDADGYYMMMTISDINHSFQIDIFNQVGLSQSAAYVGVIEIEQDLVFQFSAESAGLAGQEMVATVDGSQIVLNGSTFVPAE